MFKIFRQFEYDFGVATSYTVQKLQGTPSFQNWQAFSPKVTSQILQTDFGKILLIILPEIHQPEELEAHLPAIESLTQKGLQDSALRLVLAFSPWGEKLEKDYLKKTEFPPHILLGSYLGTPLVRFYPDSKTLWVRPVSKGRDMLRIQVNKFPPPGTQKKWGKQAVRVHTIQLDDSVPTDQKVLELINKSR